MPVTGPGSTNIGNSVQLSSGSTTVRQTPRTDFGTMVRNGVASGAGAVAGAASVAAPFVPGGAVVSAAVNNAASAMGAGGYAADGTQILPGTAPGPGSNTGTPSTGNAVQDMMNQTKDMQEMQMSFSMQYLQLQDKMQNENRQYTTLSNVMKTKHDTAKATINNVR